MKELLSKEGVNFDYIDITSSMHDLKHFLSYRDSREEFNDIKRENRVGLPTILIKETEEIFFTINEEILKKLL